MKKAIAFLLAMGVIMGAFAAQVAVTDVDQAAATADVVLDLNQNLAVVWFTKGDTAVTASGYELSLPATLEQGTSSWIATGSDLYLNWNIISKAKVQISLSISEPMKATTDAAKKVGWNVAFTQLSASGTDNAATATTLTKNSGDASSVLSAIAFKKDVLTYGNSGKLPVSVTTENIYGKDALVYKATITATVKTYE